MSIVRYTNKKTGVVTLYESTSHYDPETKQSRPVRKYLGREDPITGELIPSSRVADLLVQQETDLLDCLRIALYNDNHHYKERGPGDPSCKIVSPRPMV